MRLIISDIYNAICAWSEIHYILITIILSLIIGAYCYLIHYLNKKYGAAADITTAVMITSTPIFVAVFVLFIMACCNVFMHIDNVVEQKYIDYKAVHTKPEIKTTSIIEKSPDINTNIKAVITENGISREVNINVNSYELDNNSLNIITDNVKQSMVNMNNQRLNKE